MSYVPYYCYRVFEEHPQQNKFYCSHFETEQEAEKFVGRRSLELQEEGYELDLAIGTLRGAKDEVRLRIEPVPNPEELHEAFRRGMNALALS